MIIINDYSPIRNSHAAECYGHGRLRCTINIIILNIIGSMPDSEEDRYKWTQESLKRTNDVTNYKVDLYMHYWMLKVHTVEGPYTWLQQPN